MAQIKPIPLRVGPGCVGCGQCVAQCPTRCLMIRNGKRVYVSSDNCSLCGHCFAICPVGAIEIFNTTANDAKVDLDDLQSLETIVKYRRSIRKYEPTPLSKEEISQLLDITKYSPSACNARPIKLLVLSRQCMDDVGRQIATEMASQFPKLPSQQEQLDIVFRGAPHCLVAIYPESAGPFAQDDTTIMLTQWELVVQSQGFGTFWAGMLKTQGNQSEQIKKRLGIDPGWIIGGCLGFGKPAIHYKRSVGRLPYHIDFLE